MKNLAKLLLILFWVINFEYAHVEYDPYDWKSNIEKTILMWKYLIWHRENIINFSTKYEIKNDPEINKYIDKIDYFINSLNKIKENNFEKEREDLIISTILNEIKNTNDQLKIVLINKKYNFELNLKIKKDLYSDMAYKLSFKIEEIYNIINNNKLKDKKILTENDVRLKASLKELNNLSKKLKYFSYIEFESSYEIKNEFISILKEIKTQISIIKKNMN